MRVPLRQTTLEALPARASVGCAPDGGTAIRHAARVSRVERDDVEAVAIVQGYGIFETTDDGASDAAESRAARRVAAR